MGGSDSIRLEQFRQIKKEIRGSEDYLIVGIDVAKDKHYAFFGTPTGKTLLKKLVFENNLEGFQRLLDHEDSLDPAVIADLISQGKFLFCEHPLRDPRNLLSLKRQLKRQEHGQKVRILSGVYGIQLRFLDP